MRELTLVDWIMFRGGLGRREAEIVSVLHRASSCWVEGDAIAERLGITIENVRVQIHNLRQAHGPNFILGYRGRGYTLGAEAVALVKRSQG